MANPAIDAITQSRIAGLNALAGLVNTGLNVYQVVDRALEERDRQKAQEALSEADKVMTQAVQEKILNNDFQWKVKTDPETGESIREIDLGPDFDNLKDRLLDQYAGEKGVIERENVKRDFKLALENRYSTVKDKATVAGAQFLMKEAEESYKRNIVNAVDEDAKNGTETYKGIILKAQFLTPEQRKSALEWAEKEIKKKKIDFVLQNSAQAGDITVAIKTLNENKDAFSPQEYNNRQADIRQWYEERKFILDDEWKKLFTVPVLQGRNPDRATLDRFLNQNGVPEELKAVWSDQIATYERTATSRWFNDTFTEESVYDNPVALLKLRKEIQSDPTRRYERREDLQKQHLQEVDARLRAFQERDRGGRGESPESILASDALANAYFYLKKGDITADQMVYTFSRYAPQLSPDERVRWIDKIYSTVSSETKDILKTASNFIVEEKGQQYFQVLEEGKPKRIAISVADFAAFNKAISDMSASKNYTQEQIAKFAYSWIRPYFTKALEYTDMKGATQKVSTEPLRETEFNLLKTERADQLQEAIQSGALKEHLYYRDGRMQVNPVMRNTIEQLWSEQERVYRELTNEKTYKKQIDPFGQLYLVSKTGTYYWRTEPNGNANLYRVTDRGVQKYDQSRRGKWIEIEEALKAQQEKGGNTRKSPITEATEWWSGIQ